jgi:MFS family permease
MSVQATASVGSVDARSEGRQAWSLSAILFGLGTFFYWSGLGVYVPVLSVYVKSMGASLTVVGIVVSAYGFTQLLMRIPIGFASDRIGRRRPFIIGGLIAIVVGCLGLSIAPTPELMVIPRLIMGLGASCWVVFSVAFASYFALNQSARAMSIIAAISSGAQALAGLLGGVLSQAFGTISAFYAGVGFAALGLITMLPLKETAKPNPNPMPVRRLLAIAALPSVLVATGIAAINSYAMFATISSFVPIHARNLGVNDAGLGLLSTLGVLAVTGATLIGSRVADRIGDREVIALGMLLSGIGTLFVPLTQSFWPLVVTQVVAGFGRGVCNPTLMSLSIRSLPAHERGTGMGVFQALYSIGMVAGPPISGAVADRLGLPSVFVLTATLCGVAVIWALTARALKAEAVPSH